MQAIQLSPAEYLASDGYTHKVTVNAADVAALTKATAYSLFPIPLGTIDAAGNTVPAATAAGPVDIPNGTVVEAVQLRVFTKAAVASGTYMKISVGDSQSATRFINAQDTVAGAGVWQSLTPYTFPGTASRTITVQFDADGTNLTGVTKLDCEIYFRLTALNQFQRAAK